MVVTELSGLLRIQSKTLENLILPQRESPESLCEPKYCGGGLRSDGSQRETDDLSLSCSAHRYPQPNHKTTFPKMDIAMLL